MLVFLSAEDCKVLKTPFLLIQKMHKAFVRILKKVFINSDVITGLASLVLLNLSRCGVYDEGCEHLEGNIITSGR